MVGSNHKNAPLQWSVFVTKRPGLNRELPPGYESLANAEALSACRHFSNLIGRADDVGSRR
jgi:hypothetical protein